MEIINLKEKIINKLSSLEDGKLLVLSDVPCSKQALNSMIFKYKNGQKKFSCDFEEYIEKIDFSGIDFSHFNCINFNFGRLTGVQIDPQSIYKRSLEYAKCKGVTFIGKFDNVRVNHTNFTGSKNAIIDPNKVYDRNLEDSVCKDVCFIGTLDNVKTKGAVFTESYTEIYPKKVANTMNYDTELDDPIDELIKSVSLTEKTAISNEKYRPKINIKSLFRKRKI